MTQRQQDAMDNIMDYFDFEKVRRVMELLDWKWGPIGNRVPEVFEIRQSARRLIKEAIEKYKGSIATGGLWVDYSEDENGDIALDLSFKLEHWTEYINERMDEDKYQEIRNQPFQHL